MDAFFATDSANFNYRVAAVCIQNNHVLLHREVNDDHHWSLPGGRVKIGEEAQNAIIREISEELGVLTAVQQLIWSVENFFEYNKKKFHEIGFYYLLTAESIPFQNAPFYGKEGRRLIYQWIPLSEVEHMPLFPPFLRTEIKALPTNPKHIVVR